MIIIELLVFIILFGADQLTKYLLTASLHSAGGTIVVIPDILTFIYSENTGASFGIFSDAPWVIMIISIATCIALIVYLLIQKKKAHKFLRFSIIVLIAGAVGNIYDRLVFGYVRDFIDYTFLETWFNINFAICNVADIVLFIGAGMLLFYIIFIYKDKPKTLVAYPHGEKEKSKEVVLDIGSGSTTDFNNYDNGATKVKTNEEAILKNKDVVLRKDADDLSEIELKKERVIKANDNAKIEIEVVRDSSFTDYDKKVKVVEAVEVPSNKKKRKK